MSSNWSYLTLSNEKPIGGLPSLFAQCQRVWNHLALEGDWSRRKEVIFSELRVQQLCGLLNSVLLKFWRRRSRTLLRHCCFFLILMNGRVSSVVRTWMSRSRVSPKYRFTCFVLGRILNEEAHGWRSTIVTLAMKELEDISCDRLINLSYSLETGLTFSCFKILEDFHSVKVLRIKFKVVWLYIFQPANSSCFGFNTVWWLCTFRLKSV